MAAPNDPQYVLASAYSTDPNTGLPNQRVLMTTPSQGNVGTYGNLNLGVGPGSNYTINLASTLGSLAQIQSGGGVLFRSNTNNTWGVGLIGSPNQTLSITTPGSGSPGLNIDVISNSSPQNFYVQANSSTVYEATQLTFLNGSNTTVSASQPGGTTGPVYVTVTATGSAGSVTTINSPNNSILVTGGAPTVGVQVATVLPSSYTIQGSLTLGIANQQTPGGLTIYGRTSTGYSIDMGPSNNATGPFNMGNNGIIGLQQITNQVADGSGGTGTTGWLGFDVPSQSGQWTIGSPGSGALSGLACVGSGAINGGAAGWIPGITSTVPASAGYIPYSSGTTGQFALLAPSGTNTVLTWNGSALVWGSDSSIPAASAANLVLISGASPGFDPVWTGTAPTASGQVLTYNGTSLIWQAGSASDVDSVSQGADTSIVVGGTGSGGGPYTGAVTVALNATIPNARSFTGLVTLSGGGVAAGSFTLGSGPSSGAGLYQYNSASALLCDSNQTVLSTVSGIPYMCAGGISTSASNWIPLMTGTWSAPSAVGQVPYQTTAGNFALSSAPPSGSATVLSSNGSGIISWTTDSGSGITTTQINGAGARTPTTINFTSSGITISETSFSGGVQTLLFTGDGGGSVTSVGLTGQSYLTVTGASPITSSGTWSLDIPAGTLPLNKLAQGGATSGQVIAWNGSTWAPATDSGSGVPYTVTPATNLQVGNATSLGSGSVQNTIFSTVNFSNLTGGYNVFIVPPEGSGASGYQAATTAHHNTVIGDTSGNNLTTGGLNTLIGQNCGGSNSGVPGGSSVSYLTTGNNNTWIGNTIGFSGGSTPWGSNHQPTNCIAIGQAIGFNDGTSDGPNNVIVFGNNIQVPANINNAVILGAAVAGIDMSVGINTLSPTFALEIGSNNSTGTGPRPALCIHQPAGDPTFQAPPTASFYLTASNNGPGNIPTGYPLFVEPTSYAHYGADDGAFAPLLMNSIPAIPGCQIPINIDAAGIFTLSEAFDNDSNLAPGVLYTIGTDNHAAWATQVSGGGNAAAGMSLQLVDVSGQLTPEWATGDGSGVPFNNSVPGSLLVGNANLNSGGELCTIVSIESFANLIGEFNTIMGANASGAALVGGQWNTIIGDQSGIGLAGSTAPVGSNASQNTLIGQGVYYGATGSFNTLVGCTIGQTAASAFNGNQNIALGQGLFNQATSAASNIFIGNYINGLTTGSGNIMIGGSTNSGSPISFGAALTNAIGIGFGANPTGSNQFILGNRSGANMSVGINTNNPAATASLHISTQDPSNPGVIFLEAKQVTNVFAASVGGSAIYSQPQGGGSTNGVPWVTVCNGSGAAQYETTFLLGLIPNSNAVGNFFFASNNNSPNLRITTGTPVDGSTYAFKWTASGSSYALQQVTAAGEEQALPPSTPVLGSAAPIDTDPSILYLIQQSTDTPTSLMLPEDPAVGERVGYVGYTTNQWAILIATTGDLIVNFDPNIVYNVIESFTGYECVELVCVANPSGPGTVRWKVLSSYGQLYFGEAP